MINLDFYVDIEGSQIKVRNMTVDQLTEWLLNRVWGRIVMYCEAEVGIWLVKANGWPFVTANGAGWSLHEALVRCAMCMKRRMQNATANRVRNLEDLI